MSATDRLRELLDERGVEYTGTHPAFTGWWGNHDLYWSAMEVYDGELDLGTNMSNVSPEQAIAATLGDNVATRARQLDAIDEILRILNAEVTNDNIKYDTYSELHDMVGGLGNLIESCAEPIAATLGSGTCHMEPVKNYQVSEYATSWGCVCSSCGTFHEFTHGEGWKYCPICRAEVVDE